MSYQPSRVRVAEDLPVRSTERVSVLLRLLSLPLHHWVAPCAGVTTSVVTVLFGSWTTSACGFFVLYSATPSLWFDFFPAFAVP